MKQVAFLILLAILQFPFNGHCSAWLQPKKKGFSSSGFYYIPKADFNEDAYFQDLFSDFIKLKSQSNLEKKGLSSYVEYGIFRRLTGSLKVDVEDVKDKLILDINYNNSDKLSFEQVHKYYKASNEIEIKTSVYNLYPYMISISGIYSYGDIVWNPQNYRRIKETEYAGAAINLGTSGQIKNYNYFTDSYFKIKQYTRENQQSYVLYNSLGLHAHHRTMLQIGMYNNFNVNNVTKRYISTYGYNSAIDYTSASKELKNYAKNYLRDELLTKSSKDSYHQLSFKASFKLKKNVHVTMETFHNIFVNDAFKENTFQISLSQGF